MSSAARRPRGVGRPLATHLTMPRIHSSFRSPASPGSRERSGTRRAAGEEGPRQGLSGFQGVCIGRNIQTVPLEWVPFA
jgi:hypothetical protein